MHVVDIIDINTKKAKVVLDCDIQFALYKGEIRRFHIYVDEEIDNATFEMLMKNILPKRARERCYNLLARRNMTEYELRNKLKEGFYPKDIIDDTMDKLRCNRLVDDEYFASTYIENHQKVKSCRQMMQYLTNKGINRDLLNDLLKESNIDEAESVKRLMVKKHIDKNMTSKEELNKFCMYLLRKGYSYELIRKVVL